MKYYTEEQLKAAINSAKEVVNSRTESTNRYIRGYNDCFAFLLEYERSLRGELSLSKDITLSYNDSKEFKDSIRRLLGYKNLDDFALAMKFELVLDRRPQTGDITFMSNVHIGSAMIADSGYWVSTTETKRGIKPYRRLLSREIKLDLLARPLFIGE